MDDVIERKEVELIHAYVISFISKILVLIPRVYIIFIYLKKNKRKTILG